jgi:sulfatase maturation enzyme AslB (radical SAM superfamily)
LALALSFSVKLDVGQPDASVMSEMNEVLDLYLHRSEVSQPVEFFHSTFLSFFNHKRSPNLWFIQEEDPEQFRFITNEGAETVSRRFGEIDWKNLNPILTAQRTESTLSEKTECDDCEFLECCGGYFKWPNKDFDCEGVKTLFSRLNLAAEELRNDLDSFQELPGGLPA